MRVTLSFRLAAPGLLVLLIAAPVLEASAQTGTRIKGGRTNAPVSIQQFSAPSEIDRIKRLIANDKAEEAVAVGESLLARPLDPGSRYFALNAMCVALSHSEKYDAALETCNEAVKLRSSHWMALNSRGSVYLWLNKPGRALEDFRAALDSVKSGSNEDGIIRKNIRIAQSWLARGSS